MKIEKINFIGHNIYKINCDNCLFLDLEQIDEINGDKNKPLLQLFPCIMNELQENIDYIVLKKQSSSNEGLKLFKEDDVQKVLIGIWGYIFLMDEWYGQDFAIKQKKKEVVLNYYNNINYETTMRNTINIIEKLKVNSNWRSETNAILNKIAKKINNYSLIRNKIYSEIEKTNRIDLGSELNKLKASNVKCKNILDVIEHREKIKKQYIALVYKYEKLYIGNRG